MRAIVMTEYGGPDVLKVADLPCPEPGEGEVRIRVMAAGVNPADFKWREGMFRQIMPITFPHVLGYDIAGWVDAVGSGVTSVAAGDAVCVMLDATTMGGYAEFVTVMATQLARIPPGMDFATAASIPTPALTGVQLIEDHLRPEAGQSVLITGAIGAVGRFGVHAAKLAGAHVVAAVRPAQLDTALAIGADEAIVLDGTKWTGAAFDHIADTVGGSNVATLASSAKPLARIMTVSTTPIPTDGLPSAPVFIGVRSDPVRLASMLATVAAGFVELSPLVRLPMEEAAKAHRMVAEGGCGKIVLEP